MVQGRLFLDTEVMYTSATVDQSSSLKAGRGQRVMLSRIMVAKEGMHGNEVQLERRALQAQLDQASGYW